MPYIRQWERANFDPYLRALGGNVATLGDINYCVTRIIGQYLKRNALNYANIAGVIGTLQCVIAELYRRTAAPYEDEKIQENGDVPEYEDNYFATERV